MKLIFVVDDNDSNLTMAATALENDFRILTMPSAKKMFVLLEKKRPDLILLDVEMPEMNGLEAIAKLKENPNYSDIPVIFLTGHDDETIKAQSIEAGAVALVIKPFNPDMLINTINKHTEI